MKIEVKGLSKEFRNVIILHDINIKFERGKIYGLIGRNGSGKSVFLKMLCGFYRPTSGEILFNNIDIVKLNSFPPSTRALIENPAFLPDLSGYQNLELLASIQKIINKEQILCALDKVNLLNDKDKKYKYYSLGMKQKLGIAQVLMENPKIIILDEPFNGIEEKTAIKLRNILNEEAKNGKIIILASHIKEDIENLATDIWQFDDGTAIKITKK